MKKDLLARAQTEGHPIIDGNRVTFLWQGESAPHLIDDLHGWDEHPQKLKRLSPGLWACSFHLAPDAYLEYGFCGLETKTRFRDPLNPHRIWNGVKDYNHFFYMPAANSSPLTIRQRNTRVELGRNLPRGQLTVHTVDTWIMKFSGKRAVKLYHPPTKERVPLLIVYDGPDYLTRGRLHVIVDNLIAQKRIRPIAMAFLPNGGQRRGNEYACSDATLAWIEHDVLPLANRELKLLNIKKHPGAFGVLGASFGGLMSVYTGLRLPDIFGHVLSQSGVFETEGRDFVAVDLIRHAPARPKIHLDCGRMDFLLEDNRRIFPLLRKHGFDVTYHEYGGAHNYTSWRDNIHHGLEKIFGK